METKNEWQCNYCGTTNKATSEECVVCNSDLEAKPYGKAERKANEVATWMMGISVIILISALIVGSQVGFQHGASTMDMITGGAIIFSAILLIIPIAVIWSVVKLLYGISKDIHIIMQNQRNLK